MAKSKNRLSFRPTNPNEASSPTVGRYLFTGALVGLYFGWTFRPLSEPSLIVVIAFALLITFATAIIRMVPKDRPTFAQSVKQMPLDFVKYVIIIALLNARYYVYNWGGRPAVTVVMTLAGAATGYLMFYGNPFQNRR